MNPDEMDRYAIEFEAFHARLARFFGRRERRETDRQYLRGLLAQVQRKKYVIAVSANAPVWREGQPVVAPFKGPTGWPRKKPCLAAGAGAWETVSAVVATLPPRAWERLAVGQGDKGPRTYDWAAVRIVEMRGAVPGPEGWLLARRSVSDPTELAY